MERLNYPASLVPSSQQGGNAVFDDRHLTMSAPGSDSGGVQGIEVMQHLPLPSFSDTGDYAPLIGDGGGKASRPGGGGGWSDIDAIHDSHWRQL